LGAMDLARYRDEFPVLATKAYLISASLGPVSNRALAHLREYLDAWAGKGAPDHVWFEHVFPRMRGLKATFGALVGADPDERARPERGRSSTPATAPGSTPWTGTTSAATSTRPAS